MSADTVVISFLHKYCLNYLDSLEKTHAISADEKKVQVDFLNNMIEEWEDIKTQKGWCFPCFINKNSKTELG